MSSHQTEFLELSYPAHHLILCPLRRKIIMDKELLAYQMDRIRNWPSHVLIVSSHLFCQSPFHQSCNPPPSSQYSFTAVFGVVQNSCDNIFIQLLKSQADCHKSIQLLVLSLQLKDKDNMYYVTNLPVFESISPLLSFSLRCCSDHHQPSVVFELSILKVDYKLF